MTKTGIDITDNTALQPPFTGQGTPAPRTIRAIVERGEVEPLAGIPQGSGPQLTITVKNHPTEGICTAASITATNPFDQMAIDSADSFLDILGAEEIIYEPKGPNGVLDTGLDTVVLAVRKGGTPERRKIMIDGILSQDAGMLTLKIC
jgi:hypothetical protein